MPRRSLPIAFLLKRDWMTNLFLADVLNFSHLHQRQISLPITFQYERNWKTASGHSHCREIVVVFYVPTSIARMNMSLGVKSLCDESIYLANSFKNLLSLL